MKKKNKYSRCYTLLALLANKLIKTRSPKESYGMTLTIMILKEKMKKEFGIKSLKELNSGRLKEFEKFLENKLYG